MLLRDISLLSYRGRHTWPPTWMWTGKGEHSYPVGEVGTLKEIHVTVADPNRPDSTRPYNRIYLYMDYRDSGYVGCLLLDDAAACLQIGKLLAEMRGWSMKQIGYTDLAHLL